MAVVRRAFGDHAMNVKFKVATAWRAAARLLTLNCHHVDHSPDGPTYSAHLTTTVCVPSGNTAIKKQENTVLGSILVSASDLVSSVKRP